MTKEDYIYINVKGRESYFCPLWKIGNVVTNKVLDIITIVAKSNLKYYEVGKYHTIGHCAMIVNGEFTLYAQRMMIDEVRECTDEEINNFTNVLAEHNMYYGEYEWTTKYTPLGKPNFYKTETNFGLLWKDKDLFPIILNGKQIYYKDLQDELNGKYMTIGGDNGYSHCWSDSQSAEKVVAVIEQMFAPNNAERSNAFGCGRVMFGELYGYHFQNGALKVTLTDKPTERISIVSNT